MTYKKFGQIGDASIIGAGSYSDIAMPYVTAGMYRRYIDTNGKMIIEIYK